MRKRHLSGVRGHIGSQAMRKFSRNLRKSPRFQRNVRKSPEASRRNFYRNVRLFQDNLRKSPSRPSARPVSLPPSCQIKCTRVPPHDCRPILSSRMRIDRMDTGSLIVPQFIEAHIQLVIQQLHARQRSILETPQCLLPQQLTRLCVTGTGELLSQ
jgi:hypothetical protein